MAIENATSLNINQCKKLLKTYSSNQGFAYELLNAKTTGASQEDLKWIVTFAKEYLNNQNFDNFDKELFNIINPLDYHQLWEAGKVNIFPENYIQSILNEKYEDYDKLKNWIDNNLVSPEKIKVFLLNYLNTSQPVTDRIIFYRQYNHIKFIVDLDKNALKNIIDLKNKSVKDLQTLQEKS